MIAGTPRALVVDDHETNRLVLELMLEAAGCQTVAVSSGADALARLDDGDFDLVVTDIRMPGMDGFELLAAIRARPGAAGRVPVIATSADLISARPSDYAGQGFDAFLAKPMLVDDMLSCVAALGVTPRPQPEAPARVFISTVRPAPAPRVAWAA